MLSTQLIILNYHVVYDGDAVYLTNSNFLNSCFKGEPMRIIYRMRGKKKRDFSGDLYKTQLRCNQFLLSSFN